LFQTLRARLRAWRIRRDMAKDIDIVRRLNRLLIVSPPIRSELRQTLRVRGYEDQEQEQQRSRIIVPR
jgi:hypothetical protein